MQQSFPDYERTSQASSVTPPHNYLRREVVSSLSPRHRRARGHSTGGGWAQAAWSAAANVGTRATDMQATWRRPRKKQAPKRSQSPPGSDSRTKTHAHSRRGYRQKTVEREQRGLRASTRSPSVFSASSPGGRGFQRDTGRNGDCQAHVGSGALQGRRARERHG